MWILWAWLSAGIFAYIWYLVEGGKIKLILSDLPVFLIMGPIGFWMVYQLTKETK